MPTMPSTHALVVGIAGYQHVNPLPPTVLQDARDIHDLLVDPQHCGYAPENVRLLLDQEATQSALRQALADLAARSDVNSTVFFSYQPQQARGIQLSPRYVHPAV